VGYGLEARVFQWVRSLCLEGAKRECLSKIPFSYAVGRTAELGKGLATLRVRCDSDIVAAMAADTAGNKVPWKGLLRERAKLAGHLQWLS